MFLRNVRWVVASFTREIPPFIPRVSDVVSGANTSDGRCHCSSRTFRRNVPASAAAATSNHTYSTEYPSIPSTDPTRYPRIDAPVNAHSSHDYRGPLELPAYPAIPEE